jgi:hypothetical protein
MARATTTQTGLKRVYRSATGQSIILEMADDWSEIIFKDTSGKKLGEFEFKELDDGSYLLKRMYIEPLKRSGIGRAALEMFKEETQGASILARANDGITQNDGSHLTGDAPSFVAKMIAERLIDDYYQGKNDFDDGFFDM